MHADPDDWPNNGKCPEWDTESGATRWYELGLSIPLPAPFTSDTSLLTIMLDHNEPNKGTDGSYGTYLNHLIAAILNASCAPMTYGYTVPEILQIAEEAAQELKPGMDWRAAADLFARMNQAGGCYLDAKGNCEKGFVIAPGSDPGQCIPACGKGMRWDPVKQECVPDTCGAGTHWDYGVGDCVSDDA